MAKEEKLVRLLEGSYSETALPFLDDYPDVERDGWIYIVEEVHGDDFAELGRLGRVFCHSIASGRVCIIWSDDWVEIEE